METRDINNKLSFEFQKLHPFKWFVLQNFPFIEEDFDALTNWQLFCKLGKEMNKIINSVNLSGQQVENLTNAFNELQNYVNNYFSELNVQEEINNKLDQMAQSGELTELITQYIAQCVIVFNTVNDMKQAQNLIVNSRCKTLGFHNVGDYGNAYYIIKENLIANEKNVIALNNGLFAELIIENNTICPQTLGAFGYLPNTQSSATYDETKQDSTEILRFTTEFAINNHIQNIDYKGLIYNCSGNNVIGLPIKAVTRNYQLNINGNQATFYWDSTDAENFAFAFVGYLRGSIWQNINIRCLNSNYKGNIFTTHFDIDNQQHLFSENIFKNININSWWATGTCNKVFDFSIDGVSTHDDLSLFERITAHYYNNFFYTNNSESVSNTFLQCYTVSYIQNTIEYFIDCQSAWGGHLTINEHSFILQQPNCTIIKTTNCDNISFVPITLNDCRLEVRNNLFKLVDISSYFVKINNLRPLAGFSINNNTQYYIVNKNASLKMTECNNMPPYIQIDTSESEVQSNIIFENCSFFNGNITTPMPIFRFGNYASYQEMKQAGNLYFNNIIIKNGLSSTKSHWFLNYILSANDFIKQTSTHKQLNETYRSMYIPDCNLVIDELTVEHPTAAKCSITIANADGTGIAYRQNINFVNKIANITETIKCVLVQNGQPKTLIVSLQDSAGTTLSDQTCILNITTRPTFKTDEFNVNTNKWINK